MQYTLQMSEDERIDLARSLVLETLLGGDGHFVFGVGEPKQGAYAGVQAMLVPPDDAPNSRWYDPGPKYPKQFAPLMHLLPPAAQRSLEEWYAKQVAELTAWVLQYIPLEVEVEQESPTKQAVLLSRDGIGLDLNEVLERYGQREAKRRGLEE